MSLWSRNSLVPFILTNDLTFQGYAKSLWVLFVLLSTNRITRSSGI